MKFRKAAAVLAALVTALSFGGCLQYSGDLLQTTDMTEDTVTDSLQAEQPNTVYENGSEIVGETQNGAETSVAYLTPATDTGADVTPSTPSQSEAVTSGGSQTNTSGNSVTTPSQQSQSQQSVTGLDVLKSGTFYWKGSMQDETGEITPTEMASTSDSLYMSTSLNGADVSMLLKNGTTYIIYPKIKGYMNMKLLMKASGMDDDMFDTSALDFSSIGQLTEADSKKNTQFNGKDCVDYVFTESEGTTEIFMSGSSFLGMRSTDSSGKTLSVMYIDYLTGTVPADKCGLPTGYTEYSGLKAISFMTELAKDMDISIDE